MSGRCEALVPRSSYVQEHQCEKRKGTKKVRGRRVCAHHRQARVVKLYVGGIL